METKQLKVYNKSSQSRMFLINSLEIHRKARESSVRRKKKSIGPSCPQGKNQLPMKWKKKRPLKGKLKVRSDLKLLKIIHSQYGKRKPKLRQMKLQLLMHLLKSRIRNLILSKPNMIRFKRLRTKLKQISRRRILKLKRKMWSKHLSKHHLKHKYRNRNLLNKWKQLLKAQLPKRPLQLQNQLRHNQKRNLNHCLRQIKFSATTLKTKKSFKNQVIV